MITFKKLETEKEFIEKFISEESLQTIFSSAKFLDYHKNRFDTQYLIYSENNKNLFAIPLVKKGSLLISHPGATYGGIIEISQIDNYYEVFERFLLELRNNQYELEMKLPNKSLINKNTNKFIELIENSFRSTLTQEETIVDLQSSNFENLSTSGFNKGHKTEIARFKKNINADFKIINNKRYEEYYKILYQNTKKFNTEPTHDLKDFILLHNLFPEKIKTYCVLDRENNEIISGITIFILNDLTVSGFYSTYNYNLGKTYLGSLKYSYWKIFQILHLENYKYFNFGIDVRFDELPNEGLRYFKNGFGGYQINRSLFRITNK